MDVIALCPAGRTLTGQSAPCSPSYQGGSPCEATPHRFDHDEIALFDPAIGMGLCKRQRDRGSRGIAMAVDGDDDFLRCDTKLFGRRIDDAPVRLMRYEPIEIIGARAGRRKCIFDDIRHHSDGVAEHFGAMHAAVPDGACRRRDASNTTPLTTTSNS